MIFINEQHFQITKLNSFPAGVAARRANTGGLKMISLEEVCVRVRLVSGRRGALGRTTGAGGRGQEGRPEGARSTSK